jgi:putative DNA primase/helicase
MTKDDKSPLFPKVKPWSKSVAGATLLTELTETFKRFLVLPDGGDLVLPLWVLFTHTFNLWSTSPRLAFISKGPGAGKTTALGVLKQLVPKPIATVNMTTAVMYRVIEKYQPTLLIDEADTFTEDNKEMTGILNSGHTRDTAFVWRSHPETFEPEMFSTWGPMAIAKIGTLPPALWTRSIIIPMRKKLRTEFVQRLLPGDFHRQDQLHAKCARWAMDHMESLSDRDVDFPHELDDRTCDNWRPLLAIASEIGPASLKRARSSAVSLSRHGSQGTPEARCAEFVRQRFVASRKPVPEFVLHQAVSKWTTPGEVARVVSECVGSGLIKRVKLSDDRRAYAPGGK